MRKIFAILSTIVTIFAIKEIIFISNTMNVDFAGQRNRLLLVALTITIPLIILTLWLWISKRKTEE